MTPVIEMKPNEMQFFRIINACHQKGVPINAPPNGIKWVQTAQDGVQFTPVNPVDSTKPGNYNPAITNASFPIPASQTAPFGSLSPGNRIDLLVQAPPSGPGTFPVTFGPKNVLLFTVKVIDDKSIDNPMPFPTPAQFPAMPAFLADINPADVVVRRELHFRSTGAGNPNPPAPSQRGKNAPFPPPSHTINGKKFEDHIIDQSMLLGATEEWTLYNDTGGAAHPFHIHINPFQVIEILNPSVSATPVKLPRPWVWWDDFAIPPAAVPPGSPAGTAPVSGHVKFLSKFVDFTGMYVLHCHILGHEDRGMMQLVQVISNTTDMDHH
jgi:FtsP/CotA-like multicopper oxidase with cupredoxin domain